MPRGVVVHSPPSPPSPRPAVSSPGCSVILQSSLELENEDVTLKKRMYRMDDIAVGLAKLKLAVSSAQAKLAANTAQDSPKDCSTVESTKQLPSPANPEKQQGKKPDKKTPEKIEQKAGKQRGKPEQKSAIEHGKLEQKLSKEKAKPEHKSAKEEGKSAPQPAKATNQATGEVSKTIAVKPGGKESKPAKESGGGGNAEGSAPGGDGPQKSKAELKAERRAIQEAQRAAKEAAKAGKGQPAQKQPQKPKADANAASSRDQPVKPSSGPGKQAPKSKTEPSSKGPAKNATTAALPGKQSSPKPDQEPAPKYGTPRREGLIGPFRFPHLALPVDEDEIFGQLRYVGGNIHPASMQLGLQSIRGIIRGSTTRALALINVLHEIVSDFEPPSGKEFKRDFDSLVLKPNLAFLGRCRPLSLSMKNIVENFRHAVSNVGAETTDLEARIRLRQHLQEAGRVILAARAQIEETANTKIRTEDTILIYGYNSLITSTLDFAWKEGKRFKVMIVDSSPDFEGKLALEGLTSIGITCGYCLINALQPAMSKVTKVFLGAEAVMNNGAVMAQIGSCQVAQVAALSNIPVLVICETFKFCETVQTDSFHFNELGPEQVMLQSSPIANFRKRAQLSQPEVATKEGLGETPISDGDSAGLDKAFRVGVLNLKYDVMPAEFVTALVTEMGILPPSSVPVVNRETFLRR